jgi:hypothetical protein
MRIKRVVEIEDPSLNSLESLDRLEIFGSCARLVCRLPPRLFVAIFVNEEVRSLANHGK